MTPTDSTGPVPVQRRPDAPTVDELRHELETAYGVMLHRQHLAEGYADSGDALSRDHWRAVAQTHRADAEAVAQVLGIAS